MEKSVNRATKHRKITMILVISVIFVLFAAAYTTVMVAYNNTDTTLVETNQGELPDDGIVVAATLTGLDPATEQLTLRITASPVGKYADSDGLPTKDITLQVSAYSGSSTMEMGKGKVISTQEIKLYATGKWASYPLDEYEAMLFVAATTTGPDGKQVIPVYVKSDTTMEGWVEKVDVDAYEPELGFAGSTYTLDRTFITRGFVGIVLILFILVALAAIGVAVSVGSQWRRVEPTLLGWAAAMLFAVPALRNAMPGAPPIGAWIDVAVFLWVLLIVVIAYLVVVATWILKSLPPVKQKEE